MWILGGGETRVLKEPLFPPDTGSKGYLPFHEFLNNTSLNSP
jgi:hypothetical protein